MAKKVREEMKKFANGGSNADSDKSVSSDIRQSIQAAQKAKPVSASTKKRTGLGRGLSALMVSSQVPQPIEPPIEAVSRSIEIEMSAIEDQAKTSTIEQMRASISKLQSREKPKEDEIEETVDLSKDGLLYVPISSLRANQAQPRQHFDEDELIRLEKSIRETGMLQPLLVRRIKGQVHQFEIVAGERRWRAATRAQVEKIPVLVRDLNDQETLELGIIENVQRENLNPIEEAKAYMRLQNDFGQTQSEIAETVGKDRVSIANAIRLLRLPQSIQDLIVEGELSQGHGRTLLMIEDESKQVEIAQQIIEQGMSVRALEELIKSGLHLNKTGADGQKSLHPKQETQTKSSRETALEERFRRALGTKVSLQLRRKGKGDLKISFFSEDELQALLERLGA